MPQTSIIFGALFIGFLVFVVLRHEVQNYKDTIFGS